MPSRPTTFILATLLFVGETAAFSPVSSASSKVPVGASKTSTTQLYFGIPTFGAGKDKDEESKKEDAIPEKKIGLSGLAQLITAGMGSPFLGDFEGVDKETGKFMFSLEANNLVDEEGKSKQTSMPYFESGWVDEKDLEKERLRKEKGGGFFGLW
eukprot:CAMPEP_0203634154 /NCGR_PEP_ID=MMETSP0088-20131115/1202_1 /ASSEMBLY_ACC=CAM_ASM_001087 /TAXON_ID=426623 /ORGANISM="Chaetoceros affinis, Strain CCMP159" /LENGTH=154 /DNA_ID=CAMNT_0050487713 /DNA_START=79 /DNA_END=543 /DNA_ORIENTATION=+